MNTALDCMACFIRQALEAARFVTDDPAVHERVVRDVFRITARMDLSHPPPVVAQWIHRALRRIAGVEDPYRKIKDRFNQLALDMWPALTASVRRAPNPLAKSIRLAIAGNVIDLGINGKLTENEVRKSVAEAMHELFVGDLDAFSQAIGSAKRILYLADNAGEIVFDRLLIEQLGAERITLAVRGGPILNDATMRDAQTAGLCDMVEVIDNGSDAPGTLLDDCSDEFRRRFAQADLILAKGQGNFETLSDDPADIFFLLKVKCPVIAGHVGLPLGTHVLARSPMAQPVAADMDNLKT